MNSNSVPFMSSEPLTMYPSFNRIDSIYAPDLQLMMRLADNLSSLTLTQPEAVTVLDAPKPEPVEVDAEDVLRLRPDAETEDAVTMEPILGRPVFLRPDVCTRQDGVQEIRHVYNVSTLSHLRNKSPFSRQTLCPRDYCYVPLQLWPMTEPSVSQPS